MSYHRVTLDTHHNERTSNATNHPLRPGSASTLGRRIRRNHNQRKRVKMNYIEVIPAYGRDYTKQGDVKADWNAGLDFQDAFTRQYVNKQDATALGLKVIVRYARLMKVVAVN